MQRLVSLILLAFTLTVSFGVFAKESAPLVTREAITLAAMTAETDALKPAYKEFGKRQHALLVAASSGLIERWQSWKLDDALLRDTLSNLIVDLLAMRRLYDPQAESLLSFDRSVVVRVNTFYRQLTSGTLPKAWALREFGGQNPSLLARLYADLYALDLATKNGRMSALIWVHLLRTDPEVYESWQAVQQASEALDIQSGSWTEITNRLKGVPLARYQDLTNKTTLAAFAEAVFRIRPPRDTGAGHSITHIPISILPNTGTLISDSFSEMTTSGVLLTGSLLLEMLSGTPEQLGLYINRDDGLVVRSLALMQGAIADSHSKGQWEGILLHPDAMQAGLSYSSALALWSQIGSGAEPIKEAPWPENTHVELDAAYYGYLAQALQTRAQRFNRLKAEFPAVQQAVVIGLRWANLFEQLASQKPEPARCLLGFNKLPPSLKDDPYLFAIWKSDPHGLRLLAFNKALTGEPAQARVAGALWRDQTVMAQIPPATPADGDSDVETDADMPAPEPKILQLHARRIVFGEAFATIDPQTLVLHPASTLQQVGPDSISPKIQIPDSPIGNAASAGE